jgi:hypothetical protein
MRRIPFRGACFISALALAACATSQSESRGPEVNPADTEASGVQATISMQDGTAFERAIVLDAATEKEGGPLEYRWVAERFPGYRLLKQSLQKHEGRMYDVLQIADNAGAEHTIYFDITNYFGKK